MWIYCRFRGRHYSAKLLKEHNDRNILGLGTRVGWPK